MKAEVIFTDVPYRNFNQIRFDHFETLGIALKNKTILELGSGIGCHTEFILKHSPKMVYSVEGREENFHLLSSRFERETRVITLFQDLNKGLPQFPSVDIIYNYGLLYHLNDPYKFLERLQAIKHKQMILETCISLDKDNLESEDTKNPSQALDGIGSRPGLSRLIQELLKYYEIIIPTQPRHEWFNWKQDNVLNRVVIICNRI